MTKSALFGHTQWVNFNYIVYKLKFCSDKNGKHEMKSSSGFIAWLFTKMERSNFRSSTRISHPIKKKFQKRFHHTILKVITIVTRAEE